MNDDEKREVNKRMNAACDLIQWLDQRIATQVEHQLKQRIAQEREYWRCTVSDLIAEERERVTMHIAEERRNLLEQVRQLINGFAEEPLDQLMVKSEASVEQIFDRMAALIKGAGRNSDHNGYVVVCKKGLVVMQEYATPEEAARVLDAVAALDVCAWRRDEMFIRPATPDDRRNFKHVAGYMVMPKAH